MSKEEEHFQNNVKGYKCFGCKKEYPKTEETKAKICCYVGSVPIMDYTKI